MKAYLVGGRLYSLNCINGCTNQAVVVCIKTDVSRHAWAYLFSAVQLVYDKLAGQLG